jgi:hypothetical protein
MKKEITTTILIQAKPAKIWQILMDFENYPTWNPFIIEISGNPKTGKSIQAKIQSPGSKLMIFKSIVLVNESKKEFKWKGKLLFRGLFDGEHCFQFIDNQYGSTTFIHSEKFAGILVPFLKKMLDTNTKNGFTLMNEAIKKRAESEF